MPNEITLVQDKKTGEWYDPDQKFAELMQEEWFKLKITRLTDAAWEEGMADAARADKDA